MRVQAILLVVAGLFAAVSVAPAQTAAVVPTGTFFTPPANWAQIPRGFTLTAVKNIWQGPRVKGGHEMFAEAILPVPSSFIAEAISQSKTRGTVTGARTICGIRGHAATFRQGRGASAMLIDAEVFSKAGLTYGAIYARPSGTRANATISSLMRNLCPTDQGEIAAATPPAGWTALNNGIDFELVGVWLGNAPLQIMSLISAHQIPSADMIFGFVPSQSVRKGSQLQYRITKRQLKLCGQPSAIISAQFGASSSLSFAYDLAITQAAGVSYLLSYFHPGDYTDQAAEQSLQTLCAPAPAVSPTPSR